MEGCAIGKLTVGALRAVLVVVLAGTVFVQASMVWALATDPEDGSLPLTPLRVITILGMVSVQVALVCVWRLVTMVRRGTVFSNAAFRYVDVVIGAIVAAALVWFAVTVLNAPGQRADLVLLAGNPLEDLANVDAIEGVMVAGRWLPRAEIDRRLDAIAAGYAAARAE